MLFAMLAAFVTRKPPIVQAIVLGLCSGLFVTTAAQANARIVLLDTVIVQVVVTGVISGAAFYVGLMSQRRRGWTPASPGPVWLYAVYSVVWVAALIAALLAMFGEGGFKVAALAIVPLVVLGPPALQGFRLALRRTKEA